MTPHPELDQDRRANMQAGQPIGAEDLHATVSDGAGAPDEARTIPDPDNRTKAAYLHPRVARLPPEQAEEGMTATRVDRDASNAVQTGVQPSVWEATGRNQRAYADKDAPESDTKSD